MIDFKVGDDVICKKDFKCGEWIGNKKVIPQIIFFENKTYKINYANYWDEANNVIVYEKNIIGANSRKFLEYFYTKRETRKIKLKKIKI